MKKKFIITLFKIFILLKKNNIELVFIFYSTKGKLELYVKDIILFSHFVLNIKLKSFIRF
jgi:hypothetical protein